MASFGNLQAAHELKTFNQLKLKPCERMMMKNKLFKPEHYLQSR